MTAALLHPLDVSLGTPGVPFTIDSAEPRVSPPRNTLSENIINSSRQSIDWYMGVAADQGTHVSRGPEFTFDGREDDEDQAHKEVNGHALPVPDIKAAQAEGIEADALEDIDRSTGAPELTPL